MNLKNLLSLTLVGLGLATYAQDYAIKQLEESPRHHEWIELESNNRTLYNFVAYPEKSGKTTTVIVIHENRGLNDWARSMTDQLAEAGFIGIAPDLLSNCQEGIQKTSDFKTSDQARSAIYQLDKDQVTTDLNNVLAYAKNIPAGNGKVAVMGFCWGGSQCFRYATNNQEIEAAMVFYGTAPKSADPFQNIDVPVYGFYGGNDNRVNSTIPFTDSVMKASDKFYEYEIYEGAGHAYMRRGDDPEGSKENVDARNQSWERIKTILNKL